MRVGQCLLKSTPLLGVLKVANWRGLCPYFLDRYPLHCVDLSTCLVEKSTDCTARKFQYGRDRGSGGGSASDQESRGKGRQLATSGL